MTEDWFLVMKAPYMESHFGGRVRAAGRREGLVVVMGLKASMGSMGGGLVEEFITLGGGRGLLSRREI